MSPRNDRLLPGAHLGPYEIVGLLGAGGMGEVYKARDPRLSRTVAIKVLPQLTAGDDDRRKRLLREARTASALNHPNIVTVHDIVSDGGQDCIVMELVEGRPLDAVLSGKQQLAEIVKYAIQIADALAAAHAAGVVHRDIKPGNIIVTPAGIVKVLDFGLARPPLVTGADGETASITAEGVIRGTIAYMSPEQAEGKKVDARSDIFSFGVCLYEMLAGRRPFVAESDLRVLHAILHDAPRPLGAEIPTALRAIVEKAIEKDPAGRYQSMAEVAVDLRRCQRGTDPPLPARTRRRALVPVAVATMLAFGAAGYFRLHGKAKLTDKDTIILADFTNTTGDPVFDGTLRQGLWVELEQSPFLSIVSDQRIHKTLGLMRQRADARLTADLAQQVCTRIGSTAVLDGRIDALGSSFVLGLRARNCRTGDVLDEEQAQPSKKEDVLNALSQISRKFRSKVGESLAMVQEHATPLAEATTPSLEALQSYSAAQKVVFAGEARPAVPLLKRAIELDPKFAMAYAFLGRAYGDLSESVLSAEYLTKAYELRERCTDPEKFFIAANYFSQATGNMEKAEETFELWERTYPRDPFPPGLLSGQIYPFFGKYEQAVEQAGKLMALDPQMVFSYINMATADQFLNRYPDAEAAFRRSAERVTEAPLFLAQHYDLAFASGNQVEMDELAARAKGKAGAEHWLADHEAQVLAYSGRWREARTLFRTAVQLARQDAGDEPGAQFSAGVSVWEALFGNVDSAKQSARDSLKLSKGRDVEYGAGLALAVAGDSSAARALVDDLAKRFPEDSGVRIFYLPAIRAAIALDRHEPSQAIDALQIPAPYDLGAPLCWFNGSFGILYSAYLRGQAYLAAHRGNDAAAEFQKIVDHRGLVSIDPIGALARLQLARALFMAGDKTKAKTAYADFLTLWKDGDRDIPVLLQAKAEAARLE